ncbi:MAG: hydroxyacid dehydrogenase [bacterium]|nr:hydroxyacid dehydrogenase [bacterium]
MAAKVLVCDSISEDGIKYMKDNGLDVTVKTGMTPDELIANIKEYNAIIVRSATKATADVIAAADNLKLIVRGGVGVDNIDVKAAEKKKVQVRNTPGASTVSVAEHTMALLLSLVRQIPATDKSMKEGKWEKKKFEGTELFGKTLGLIGSGRIGTAVAKRCQAFEMKVMAYDPYADDKTLLAGNIKPVKDLDELLRQADIVSLHIPKTEETKNILNKERISKMKDGSIIVNAARGGVVDEEALAEALKSGKLYGAALDVFSTEPLQNSPLTGLSNVVLAPHIGAATKEAQKRIGLEAAKTIVEFFK